MSSDRSQPSKEIFLLPLTDDGAPDVPGGYIYLPPPASPPYSVRFAIEGTSSICREGSLWTNLPAEGAHFDREKYREFKLRPDFNHTLTIDVPITTAGAFAFYTTYTPLPEFSTNPVVTPKPTQTPTYYIDVEPKLTLGKEVLPLDSLSIFSILSKFMGKYPTDWNNHLKGIAGRGYNMVHFTPLNHRGESNSPYSLFDQLAFDPEKFPNGEKDIADLVKKMKNEHGLLALTDVVWNHTANNSEWLQEHPEAGYNVETAPWLEAALELDDALLKYSDDLESLGLPTNLKSVEDLAKITDGLNGHVLSKLKLWQYYTIDVEGDTDASVQAWTSGSVKFPEGGFGGKDVGGLEGIKDWSDGRKADFLLEKGLFGNSRMGRRFQRRLDPGIGSALLSAIYGRYDAERHEDKDVATARDDLKGILDIVNVNFYREYDADAKEIQAQIFNRVKYVRLDDHGPKLGPITKKSPLIESYFTRLPVNAKTEKHERKALALANNGWVWNANAMRDNAGPDSKAYLRRELIVWGDCVKLRYGTSPKDSPYLWDRIARYTRLMAKHFDGFRIDNCHSTPLALAEYMLDEARNVRPNLAVFAELFTGSEEMDYVFVERLGISALIREAMQAWSTGELSRLVHRHGGIPIGSFDVDVMAGNSQAQNPANQLTAVNGASAKEVLRSIRQSPVHALFMDCTHDNEVPAQKRDARDTLPNAALVSMCASATGSVMGYDEIYPKIVDLVSETRLYRSAFSENEVKIGGGEGGIGGIKKLLNQIHTRMGQEGYDETHIHHEGEYITVHRVHPKTRRGYFLIAHTAFPGYGNGSGSISPTYLTGTKAKGMGSWLLEVDASEETKSAVINDKQFLRGLPSRVIDLAEAPIETKGETTIIRPPEIFPPGSIALFETWIPTAEHSDGLDTFSTSGAEQAFKDLDLIDLNFVLYRCDPEERDISDGRDGTYAIPNYGFLVYAGLQGWWSVLKDITRNNDLGHPMCQHLRDGQWALDYIVGRLERTSKQTGHEQLEQPAIWFKERFDAIRPLPSFLLPRYFALVLRTAYRAAWNRSLQLMGDKIRYGQGFLQSLGMVSLQMTGSLKSTSLWPTKNVPCMAAGLPHFAVDWARCWGRDVFISLRGLFLGTGRFDDAKEHILAFGSVLKHGMIPNLLSSGKLPRYNSRDSIWFYLQNIQDYTKLAPSGLSIFKEKVSRRFLPYDDTWFAFDDPRAYSKTSTIEEIIQEAMQRHASGMSFREANAGPSIDSQMRDEGFNIEIHVDWATGIIFGGNQFNCGTWMDKMGESEKAGNKGIPGTPRDGAAVEITGMLYSTLVWLAGLHKKGKYSYGGVKTENGNISFEDWAAKIKSNFERCYYVPLPEEDSSQYDVNPKVINRRGIYKDLYKSGKEYEDYQLRPNFPIAMCVAPELFDPKHALHALAVADNVLRGPTGMATLDPADLNYRPYYINSEDSTDFATSKGRNYHQGPEWLWPTGFFLRALLKFDLLRRTTKEGRTESFQQVTRRLKGCKTAIANSPWAGLAELTQKDGAFCPDSSPTQAWSAGCLIDLFQDAAEMSRARRDAGRLVGADGKAGLT